MTVQNNIKINKPYFKNLDALRFLAALAVFVFHFFSETTALFQLDRETVSYKAINLVVSKGTLGVNFFFVLSGFLITYLILFERQATSNFNVKHFLIRRTLRIWPLYFLIVVLGFVIFPLLLSDFQTNHSVWYYVFFLANFDEIAVGLADPINFLTAPWSVAVEEQFYLFWGLLLFVLHRLKVFRIELVLVSLLILSIVFSYKFQNDARVLYYHTFSVMSNIIIGSGLAYFYFQKKEWLMKFKDLQQWKIFLIYAAGFLIIITKNKIFVNNVIILEQSMISLFFAFIIFDQVYLKNSIFKVGKIKLFNHLGKISYGLYLYHLVVMYLLLYFGSAYFSTVSARVGIFVFLFLSILGTYCLSYLSFNFFEKPFLLVKRKFS